MNIKLTFILCNTQPNKLIGSKHFNLLQDILFLVDKYNEN